MALCKNWRSFAQRATLIPARVVPQRVVFPRGPNSAASRGALQVRMVLTESAPFEIGAKAPSFALTEPLTGKTVTLDDFQGAPAYLVMFICNHCPYVVHLKEELVKVTNEYKGKGVAIVGISSNSTATHPQDGPDKMAEDATKFGYSFPYLFDETQEVAKAYKAACTPEFYVFDKDQLLVYHGQFDDTRPKRGDVPTGKDLRAALDAVLAGQPVPKARPSIGCNIKWHPGQEPDYYGTQQVKK